MSLIEAEIALYVIFILFGSFRKNGDSFWLGVLHEFCIISLSSNLVRCLGWLVRNCFGTGLTRLICRQVQSFRCDRHTTTIVLPSIPPDCTEALSEN